jgi:predicted ATPase
MPSLYRALRLAHACSEGRIARTIVEEGGMPSIVYPGQRRGEPKVEIAVDLEDVSYLVCIATVGSGAEGPGAGAVCRSTIAHGTQRPHS